VSDGKKKNEVPVLATLLGVVFIVFVVWLILQIGLIPAAIVAVAALVLINVARWCWLPTGRVPRNRVRHMRLRLHLRLHPGRGHASVFDLMRWGRVATWRYSARTRDALSSGERLAAAWKARELSVRIGRGHYRHGLRLPLDEHVLVWSPPRKGKSGWLAQVVLHYPGPVVSTTTKHDIAVSTMAVRARRGPVHVFNPQRIGGLASTFRWNPLEGCEEPATAIRRADAFASSVSQKGVEDASFWSTKASDYLRALFMAGALAGGDMRMVSRWVLSGDASEAEAVLWDNRRPDWAAMLAELRGDAQKTVQTVRMTMSRSLSFLADPQLAEMVRPGPGTGLDIEAFLAQSGTLYMIASAQGEESPVAALFACLCNEVHWTGGLVGSRSPAGHLDPPALFALDEITQIVPVPAPSWLADSGGKGMQMIVVAHGEAQLRSRWGKDGARAIGDCTGLKMLLTGVTDPDTLDSFSKLCGEVSMRLHDHTQHSRHRVMEPDMISRLPKGCALLVRGGFAPVIAHLALIWHDRLYKQARWAAKRAAVLTPAAQHPVLGPVPARIALPPAPVAVEAPREAVEGIVVSPPVKVTEPPSDEPAFPWSAR
jgi:type IV secretion system protein VirD4